jgi:hypothetical protein
MKRIEDLKTLLDMEENYPAIFAERLRFHASEAESIRKHSSRLLLAMADLVEEAWATGHQDMGCIIMEVIDSELAGHTQCWGPLLKQFMLAHPGMSTKVWAAIDERRQAVEN